MRCACVLLSALLIISLSARAQEPPKPAPPPASADGSAAAGKPPAGGVTGKKPEPKTGKAGEDKGAPRLNLPVPLGDIVHLKSGKKIPGVQVIRSSAAGHVIEIEEGMAPITIPLDQVENIEFDDIDPNNRKAPSAVDAGENGQGIQGQKLSEELSAVLNKPLGEAVEYEKKDLVEVLDDLSKRTTAPITIDQSVKDLPSKKRAWSLTLGAEATLLEILRDSFAKDFPDIDVVYDYDKIMVSLKKTEEKTAAPAPPPALPEAKPSTRPKASN